jgi:hypothetical protein
MAIRATANPGLGPGQLVRIAISGQERATASITHVTATWIGLRLVGPDSRSMREFNGARASLECIGVDGIHRINGDLEQPGGPSSPALRLILRSGPQLLGRRQHLRSSLAAPLVLTNERTGEKHRGRSANVGGGGMLAEDLDGALPSLGERLRFALAPKNSREAITGTAVVTRVNKATREIALQFEHLPRASADELARVVFEHHQGARAPSLTRPSRRRGR